MSRLLDQALDLDPDARQAWFDALPQQHADLAPALRYALNLGGVREGRPTLPEIAQDVAYVARGGCSLRAPGRRVGPYELIRELGSGGMAVVWYARRADGAFKRNLALKIPVISRSWAGVADRFARECDILASLEHPRIARLYDAGIADDGTPYLALEYIEGKPLTAWCDTRRSGLPERLQLFLQVLEAVQYAHAKQVVHRDLKPSNILVTDDREVRLLDFGVAKVITDGEAGADSALTLSFGLAVTPAYASPEQLRGEPVGAGTDIYALGVVLYELLTGALPYTVRAGGSMAQLAWAVERATIEQPSVFAKKVSENAPDSLATGTDWPFAKALDSIVMRSLAKTTGDRYSSVSSLAGDLRRYLRGDVAEIVSGNSSEVRTHRFGRFEIRPQQRQLLADGRPVRLTSRAIDLLILLVEQRDRVVPSSELMERVWPSVSIDVNTLRSHVSALRKALGASAIATIPGRGYRFIASLGGQATQSLTSTLADAFPQPRSSNLPAGPLKLFGRGDELSELTRSLRQHRHVTIVGAGGIGKTALALSAARSIGPSFADGVAWVELAPLAEAGLLPASVAQCMRLPVGRGVSPLPALVSGLAALEVLLVLDNAEHMIEAVAALVDAVVAGAPRVRLLVTSQAPVKAMGERVFRLAPLRVPPADTSFEQALSNGAVALFAERANAADRRFVLSSGNISQAIALCRHLDGIPLALQLAAARIPFFGLRGLLDRIGAQHMVLVGGSSAAPTRHQTLHAALDWSYSLLAPNEQAVFRRLAVLAGGFSLDTAGAVGGEEKSDPLVVIECLGVLVERSLVVADEADPPRYRLLESAREYASHKLVECGEFSAAHRNHALAMLALFERADDAAWNMSEVQWMSTYACELDNVRAALDWSRQHDVPTAIALLGRTAGLHLNLGLRHEYRRRCEWLEPTLGFAGVAPDSQARYWLGRSRVQWCVSNPSMREYAEKARTLFLSLDDRFGLCLAVCCNIASWLGPSDRSEAMLRELEALDRGVWQDSVRGMIRWAQLHAFTVEGRYVEAREAAADGRALAESAGYRRQTAMFINHMVAAELELGRIDSAVSLSREVLAGQGSWRGGILYSLGYLAQGLIIRGDCDEARQVLAEFFRKGRNSEWDRFDLFSDVFVQLAVREGRAVDAASLLGFSDAAWQRIGQRTTAGALQRDRTYAWLGIHLRVDHIQHLIAVGGRLAEEDVCALTLGSAWSR